MGFSGLNEEEEEEGIIFIKKKGFSKKVSWLDSRLEFYLNQTTLFSYYMTKTEETIFFGLLDLSSHFKTLSIIIIK